MSAEQSKELTAISPEAEIKRLAQLTQLDYHRNRLSAAKSLNIRLAALDGLVANERKQKPTTSETDSLIFKPVEPWPSMVDGDLLLNELEAFIKRYVVCEQHTINAVALWITFTWLVDAVTVAPIANITAPLPNCGKSTLLDLLEHLCFKPLKVDNVSPAALFRSIDKWKPTLLIDEADAFLKDNEDARGILNSGHKRNGYVLRVVGEQHEPRRFSTWGAKAICGIGSISSTLRSRSIRMELRRKHPHQIVGNLRHASPEEIAALRSKLARFSADVHELVAKSRPAPIPGLENRAQDNWEPLMAIAEACKGDWPQRTVSAAQAISGSNLQDNPDTATELLSDIRKAFQQKQAEKLFTAELIETLCADPEAPWSTWNRGNPISARQLSSRMTEFGIRPDDVRIGATVRKGYNSQKFDDVFRRYLPD